MNYQQSYITGTRKPKVVQFSVKNEVGALFSILKTFSVSLQESHLVITT